MRKGFTLIELLVVISIIGLLSSIVLASLAQARQKANKAAILEEMASLRNAAGMFGLNHNGDYGPPYLTDQNNGGADCDNSNTGSVWQDLIVRSILTSIRGRSPFDLFCQTSPDQSKWSIYVQMPPNNGPFACVDSSGKLMENIGAPGLLTPDSACP